MIDFPALLQAALREYALDREGIHGVTHWARVLENGRRLAASTGADLEIVQCFAILHDARRRDDGFDREHGARGADLASSLRGTLLLLPDDKFEILHSAIAAHSNGVTEGCATAQTCWDADRLDLPRIGVAASLPRLCTDAGRDPEIIAWAAERGRTRAVPELLAREWAIVPLEVAR